MTEFTEDRVPYSGIDEAVSELIELFGGEIQESRPNEWQFTLPMRRGVATAGGIECTLRWTAEDAEKATVTMVCDRDVDAPRAQRVALLVAGAFGGLLFTAWPFFAQRRELGTIAWIGGAIAIAVYLLTLRKTSGGIAADFLQRLVHRQRSSES